ncbi:50S ribosomal protein L3 [bacterium]|nr:50S ribosomal protein L3 [bacterium]
MRGILGKKIGMTRFFDERGNAVPATLVEAGPCIVVQIKTEEKDGYNALQLGFVDKKEKRVTRPLMGHFKKAGSDPKRILKEFRDLSLDAEVKPGDVISADVFSAGDIVKITGRSIGKGFAGVMKRHGFSGGPKTHGQGDRWRAPGSIGQSATPNRVIKGIRMAGRKGNKRVTIRNVKVLKVIADKNLLLVEGGIPGSKNSIVEIRG